MDGYLLCNQPTYPSLKTYSTVWRWWWWYLLVINRTNCIPPLQTMMHTCIPLPSQIIAMVQLVKSLIAQSNHVLWPSQISAIAQSIFTMLLAPGVPSPLSLHRITNQPQDCLGTRWWKGAPPIHSHRNTQIECWVDLASVLVEIELLATVVAPRDSACNGYESMCIHVFVCELEVCTRYWRCDHIMRPIEVMSSGYVIECHKTRVVFVGTMGVPFSAIQYVLGVCQRASKKEGTKEQRLILQPYHSLRYNSCAAHACNKSLGIE